LVGFGFKHLETEFLPQLDEGAVLLQTIMPPGTSLPESTRLNQKIENWVKDLQGVETVVRRTGHAPGAEDTDSVNHSDITVKLVEKSKRPVSLDTWIGALKVKTSEQPSIVVNYLMPLADKINDALGGVPADIGIDFYGPDLEQLHGFAEALVKKMEQVKGLTDLRPPTDIPVPSLEISINKKEAGRLGILTRNIQDTLEAFSHGIVASQVRELQKQINVTIHLGESGESIDLESLRSLPLRTSAGNNVPLEQVAEITYGDVPSEINHEHQSRKLTVTANIQGRSGNDVAADIEKKIAELNMPAGYGWDFSGKYQSEQTAQKNIAVVLVLAIVIVSLILWVEFRSWIEVGLILLTIPLAAIGAVLSLWVFHQSVNVSSMIGAIMLVGIVVRNGIMLLDYLNIQRERGVRIEEAIIHASTRRMRPILMTATVTVLGLLPLAMGWGTGAELQRPLAIAVIGGLLTSTLLTLVVLPAAAKIVLTFQERVTQ
jgi:heavy metal efflux system protein